MTNYQNNKYGMLFLRKMSALMMVLFLITGACSESQNSFPPENPPEEPEGPDPLQTKKWTFMFYDDADFNNAYDPLEDFHMSSGENLDVVVLQDKKNSPTYLWYINKDGQKVKQREFQDLNMGDYMSLCHLIDSLYKRIASYYEYSIDIYDLAEKFLTAETVAQTRATLYEVQECLENTVIAECHGEFVEGSHGLSIYFPDPSEGYYNYLYGSSDYGLDFSTDTHWDDLLAVYFGPGKSRLELFFQQLIRFPPFTPPDKKN